MSDILSQPLDADSRGRRLPDPPAGPDLEMTFYIEETRYHLWGAMGPGGPVLMGVEITGGRLDASDLRQPLLSTFVTNFSLTEGAVKDRVVRRGRPVDLTAARQRLDVVAQVARCAEFGSRGKAVAEHFGISQGYARQLISTAAQNGYRTWPIERSS